MFQFSFWNVRYSFFIESTKNHTFKLHISHDFEIPVIYSENEDAETKTRIGRQQNGDTYTLEISFPAVKYVLQ